MCDFNVNCMLRSCIVVVIVSKFKILILLILHLHAKQTISWNTSHFAHTKTQINQPEIPSAKYDPVDVKLVLDSNYDPYFAHSYSTVFHEWTKIRLHGTHASIREYSNKYKHNGANPNRTVRRNVATPTSQWVWMLISMSVPSASKEPTRFPQILNARFPQTNYNNMQTEPNSAAKWETDNIYRTST